MAELFQPTSAPSFSWSRVLHYVGAGLLIAGGLVYWALKPSSLNPMADPMAAEAMALVQTHRAKTAPTLLQAITDRAKTLSARGQGVRIGEWSVEHETGDIYLVRVIMREQGTKTWVEREYVWRADVGKRSITPLTLPATELMPPEEVE